MEGADRNKAIFFERHKFSVLIALLAAVSVTLAACSTLRLGYNNAETLALYALDSYFDADDAQEAMARERLRSLLNWHRSAELPAYVALLNNAERSIDRKLSVDDVMTFNRDMTERLSLIGERAAPDLALLAATLKPEQIDRFAAKMKQDLNKARREFASSEGKLNTEAALNARVKRFAERMDSWVGTLTPEQLEMARAAFAAHPRQPDEEFTERARRQTELVALVRKIATEQPEHALATAWLRTHFADVALPRDAQRRERTLAARRASAELLVKTLNVATPAQKTALAKRLRTYADDFAALARESVAAAKI